MNLVSVNVGRPREVQYRGKPLRTSIFKNPVDGPVPVTRLNLAGDEQADPSVHGGRDKAVYVYPSEHYPYWREQLPGTEFPWGAFGENLTTEGLTEESVSIGDRLIIGTAEFVVTQPRLPCFKLTIRFGRADMVKRFLQSGRTGFYLAVRREGAISAADPVRVVSGELPRISVADIVRLHTREAVDSDLLRRASEAAALPENWREAFRHRLSDPGA